MVLLRFHPSSMFKKRARTQAKKTKRRGKLDESDRTHDMSLDERDELDASNSLDEYNHVTEGSHQDIFIFSPSAHPEPERNASIPRVSFRDVRLGLTPRHVVTHTHYRPRTTDGEKRELYYNAVDFEIFEQEELYDRIENEIQEIESQQKLTGKGDDLVVKIEEDMKIRNLMRRVERRYNFNHIR